jgi:cell division septum initiation protein DivIVA
MTHPKITEIQGKLTQGMSGLSREDVEWLLNRVEELEKENEWLKKEVAYGEHQGEVGY